MSTKKRVVWKRVDRCPKCQNSDFRIVWVNGRKLQQSCTDPEDLDCTWKSEPFAPEKQAVKTVKTVSADEAYWNYEGFDQYGHTYVASQGFDSKKECIEAAREDIAKMSENPNYGKCVAVIWPPTAKMRGTLVR